MVLLWRKCLVKSVRGSFPSVKSIDPDDGSTLGSREFSTSFDTITFDSRYYMYFDHMGPRTRQAFSSDYSKVVASKSDNSGSGNVGTIADILMNPATFMTWRLSCRPQELRVRVPRGRAPSMTTMWFSPMARRFRHLILRRVDME